VALKHYMVGSEQIRGPKSTKMSRGFSLIELMIAMAVLAVGILGGIVVIAVATANDGRSKLHTTAAALAQSTMEKITAIPAKAAGTDAQTQITDCTGNNFTIETAAGADGVSGRGAPLIASGAFAGSIDFSQPPQPNYSMNYVMCLAGGNVPYDVRWRIDPGTTPSTQLVTVSAKPAITNGAAAAQFTLPSTLRQTRGNF
jgi:prepilin-type N-terminal cleavage/methylation domain-containing protein